MVQSATTVSLPTLVKDDANDPRPHPLGSHARVLLCSVFGPFAQDDRFGSRRMNPMELYHNQVTREQGPFSVRMFHRSWGLMLIQANISAPCTLLDFPTRERFIEELAGRKYDIIGIGAIIPNVKKVVHMCELIRQYQPQATIVIGGHVSNVPNLAQRTGADHVVRGEGVRWFRQFLGENPDLPVKHPRIVSGVGARGMGVKLRERPDDVAATLIPSVGCPMGCNFCATSHMFGGKGKAIHFYPEGDQLFKVMLDLERDMKVRSFFIADENFLLHRKRALRLLELMEEHGKSWSLYTFSSANVLKSYSIDQLVRLGISWVWMGLEGKNSQYAKLSGNDTLTLVRELQSHGIRVLGSSIIGLEEHTPENIEEAIEYAAAHDTEFHQFMLYTPIPGTGLFAEHRRDGTLLDPEVTDYESLADTHGQYRFNYRHKHLPPGSETQYIRRAFQRDFEVNGPSILRMVRTMLLGWRRYKNCEDRRVRARYQAECGELSTTYAAALWAARRWYRQNPALYAKMDDLLRQVYREFGVVARLVAPLAGRYVLHSLRREDRRLRAGWSYEPPTFCDRTNQPGMKVERITVQEVVGRWLRPTAMPGW